MGTQQQFHFTLRDLYDTQLWEVLSEVHLETARWETVVPLVGLPLGLGGGPGRGANAGAHLGEVPLPGGGDGNLMGRTLGPQAPSNGGGCWMSPQYPCHRIKVGYSKNQYLQWQCHARKNWDILWAMVPWGTMHQGSLPRIGGPGKYC